MEHSEPLGGKGVVVSFDPELKRYPDQGLLAMRCRELGLTGYGRDCLEAQRAFGSILHFFLGEHRRRGDLEQVLERSGVVWCWVDEYQGEEALEAVPVVDFDYGEGPPAVDVALGERESPRELVFAG